MFNTHKISINLISDLHPSSGPSGTTITSLEDQMAT